MCRIRAISWGNLGARLANTDTDCMNYYNCSGLSGGAGASEGSSALGVGLSE